jgi:hypothetical protein
LLNFTDLWDEPTRTYAFTGLFAYDHMDELLRLTDEAEMVVSTFPPNVDLTVVTVTTTPEEHAKWLDLATDRRNRTRGGRRP